MLALFETSIGYALFKINDNKQSIEKISEEIKKGEFKIRENIKLKGFSTFQNSKEALEEASLIKEGKIGDNLKNFLKNNLKKEKEKLIVNEKKLANQIDKKLKIKTISETENSLEIMRGIRQSINDLLKDLLPEDIEASKLGLSHSVSRHVLNFNPDKIDTMIVQSIKFLDNLDKDLNLYSMRLKEWYGWHFPELSSIINDSLTYARIIIKMGKRGEKSSILEEIIPGDLAEKIREAEKVSIGTELTDSDMEKINGLALQVERLAVYRGELFEYIQARMRAIAPNLSKLVGELIGARLIAHAGSLNNLSKLPASTIQLLGAEKALFRALKNKKNTPKYGILFHASLVGQAQSKAKGKIARALAAKVALGTRIDNLHIDGENTGRLGAEYRSKLESRLFQIQSNPSNINKFKNQNNFKKQRFSNPKWNSEEVARKKVKIEP